MSQKKAVIFDMDGVIFDSEILVTNCWKSVAQKYNIPNIEEACREALGINAVVTKELFLKRYGEDFPYDIYKKEMSELFHKKANSGELLLKKGVTTLLSFLKEHDYKIGLASSTRKAVVESELKTAGIFLNFDVIVCGDMVKRSKPEPDIYEKACKMLQIQPENCYAIEDSYNGIRSAYRAKIKPIMVPDLLPANEEMKQISIAILDSLFDVILYLQTLENY